MREMLPGGSTEAKTASGARRARMMEVFMAVDKEIHTERPGTYLMGIFSLTSEVTAVVNLVENIMSSVRIVATWYATFNPVVTSWQTRDVMLMTGMGQSKCRCIPSIAEFISPADLR